MTNKSNEILISDNIISNDIQANDEISREDDTVVISTHDTNVEQPIKKKRGRKPKSKLENPEPKEKKKRGRKPKLNKTVESKQIIQPRRRGRKPKDKFKYETTDFNEYQSTINQEENIIIKLPLTCLQLNNEETTSNLLQYNPVLTNPEPFDQSGSHYANVETDPKLDPIQDNRLITEKGKKTEGNEIQIPKKKIQIPASVLNNVKENPATMEEPEKTLRQIDVILNKKYNYSNEKITLLNELINKNDRPKQTNILCFWCNSKFEGCPWGIPTKYVNDKFELYGIFCSPKCTLAHILQNYQNDDYIWETVSLLNLLYFKIYGKYENLIPSLDKISLKQFGGSLDEEQYREIILQNEKGYSIEFPPCNNIIPVLEEIYKKTNLNATFIPIDKNRIKKAGDELKLKRYKPINHNKKTLDDCMSINLIPDQKLET